LDALAGDGSGVRLGVTGWPRFSHNLLRRALTRGLRLILATASGAAVANLYYNQPMLADIGRTFRAGAHEVGLIATVTQVGYAIGMPLFIPQGDFINRRAVVVLLFAAVACALVAAAISPGLAWLMAASFSLASPQ